MGIYLGVGTSEWDSPAPLLDEHWRVTRRALTSAPIQKVLPLAFAPFAPSCKSLRIVSRANPLGRVTRSARRSEPEPWRLRLRDSSARQWFRANRRAHA